MQLRRTVPDRLTTLVPGMIVALVACGDDDDGTLVMSDAATDAHVRSPLDSEADHPPPDSSMSAVDSGSDGSMPATDSGQVGSMQNRCEGVSAAFEQFLSQHQECEVDDDCTVIGDCAPNADFRAIRADAADDGYELMQKRCSGAADGPIYNPVCRANRCALEMITIGCCGCPIEDSDAGGL